MTEEIDNFYDRIYVNATGYNPVVLVFPSVKTKNLITSDKKLRPERWTVEQAKQYIRYLKSEEIEI